MAYATILVRCLFLSPGRLIKKVGRDVMERDFFILLVLFFKIIYVVYFIMRRASGRELRLPVDRADGVTHAECALRGRLVILTAQLSVTRVVFGHGDAIK